MFTNPITYHTSALVSIHDLGRYFELGHRHNIFSISFVKSFMNFGVKQRGTFKVLDLYPNNPYLRVGGTGEDIAELAMSKST